MTDTVTVMIPNPLFMLAEFVTIYFHNCLVTITETLTYTCMADRSSFPFGLIRQMTHSAIQPTTLRLRGGGGGEGES